MVQERKIGILGSTGSIGTQTLEIVDQNPGCKVVSMAAGKNVELFEKQIRKYKPEVVAMWTEEACKDLRTRIADLDVRVVCGMDGLLEVSTCESMEILVTAIVGMIGIRPTIAAIQAGKTIALANKETLVTAGHIIMPLAKEKKVPILPVDSEHSAIFQSLQGNEHNSIHRILLTASGGPFRGKTREQLEQMTVKDALKHPNWSMGQKVTIDSASLVNKGLEVMEARWLFDVDIDQICVLVHPQSILHSAVEYTDGAVMGQMGVPDMKLPIQYALFYPYRKNFTSKPLDLYEVQSMTFEKPDMDTFTGLKLALQAGKKGGNLPTIFNAANEKAVAMFLQEKIRFLEIPEMIARAMENVAWIENPTVEEILETEAETYRILQS